MAKVNRKRKTWGYAHTKEYPHKRHPAYYVRKGQHDIDYITFTHSSEVDFEDGKVTTIKMPDNISPKERAESPNKASYAYPNKFKGTREALGEESNEYDLTPRNRDKMNELMNTLPEKQVPYTSNSKKKDKKKESAESHK